jgi:hypothetical protein
VSWVEKSSTDDTLTGNDENKNVISTSNEMKENEGEREK